MELPIPDKKHTDINPTVILKLLFEVISVDHYFFLNQTNKDLIRVKMDIRSFILNYITKAK